MVDATGEADQGGLRVDFDARLKLECHGSWVTSDAGLLAEMATWSLTLLREKVVKIGAKVIAHARYTIFQMAEVAVPREMFAAILEKISELRGPLAARC